MGMNENGKMVGVGLTEQGGESAVAHRKHSTWLGRAGALCLPSGGAHGREIILDEKVPVREGPE